MCRSAEPSALRNSVQCSASCPHSPCALAEEDLLLALLAGLDALRPLLQLFVPVADLADISGRVALLLVDALRVGAWERQDREWSGPKDGRAPRKASFASGSGTRYGWRRSGGRWSGREGGEMRGQEVSGT